MRPTHPYANRRPQAPSVPLEVAQRLRDDAVLTRRAHAATDKQLQRTIEALEASELALHEALQRPTPPPAEPAPTTGDDDRIKRLSADLANIRRHRDEAVAAARETARAELLGELADVHDDLERAVDAAEDAHSPWVSGLATLRDGVRTRLERLGATPIATVGAPFDPRTMEAVGTAPGPEHIVVVVHRPGFILDGDTLVRPAQVVVGTSPPGGG